MLVTTSVLKVTVSPTFSTESDAAAPIPTSRYDRLNPPLADRRAVTGVGYGFVRW